MALYQALSNYGFATVIRKERLVSELLFNTLGVEVGDPGYDGLLNYTLSSLQHHKFLDCNPSEVEDLYRRLLDRLGEFAQFDKQRALGLLERRLLQLQLPSTQYDFTHRLLAFLYCSSRGAIHSEYKGSALVEKLIQQEQTAGLVQPTYFSDSSEDGSGHGAAPGSPHATASTLSEWSDVEEKEEQDEEEQQQQQDGSAAAADTTAASPDVAGSSRLQQPGPGTPSPTKAPGPAAAASAGAAHGAATPPSFQRRSTNLARLVPPPRGSPYRRDSLAVWLASKKSGGHPARVLNPQLCFTEAELLQQVMHMLQGVSEPGPAFQLDPVRSTYAVVPGVHMHASSGGSTRALLARFADLGSVLRSVHEFCQSMLTPDGEDSAGAGAGGGISGLEALMGGRSGSTSGAAGTAGGGGGSSSSRGGGQEGEEDNASLMLRVLLKGDTSRLRELPTAAAFAAALDSQLKVVQQQLIPLEAAARSGAFTLLQLAHHLEGARRQARALQAVARECVWRGNAAQTASELLDAAHDLVQREMLQAASQGGALAAMALHIFTATAKPYLDKLHDWVFEGDLSTDSCGELCIAAADPPIPPTSPKFWASAFRMRRRGDGAPAAPAFLLPLAEPLLAAGKSAVLFRAAAEQAPQPPPAAAARGRRSATVAALPGSPSQASATTSASSAMTSLLSWRSVGSTLVGSLLGTPRARPSAVLRQMMKAPRQRRRRRRRTTQELLNAIYALGYSVASDDGGLSISAAAVGSGVGSPGGRSAAAEEAGTPTSVAGSVGGGLLPTLSSEEAEDLLALSLDRSLHQYFVATLHRLMQHSGDEDEQEDDEAAAAKAALAMVSGIPLASVRRRPGGKLSAAAAAAEALATAEGRKALLGALGRGPEVMTNGHDEAEDWLIGAASDAAAAAHALNLAPDDDLPPLAAVPRSALALQTPQALVRPEEMPNAAFPAPPNTATAAAAAAGPAAAGAGPAAGASRGGASSGTGAGPRAAGAAASGAAAPAGPRVALALPVARGLATGAAAAPAGGLPAVAGGGVSVGQRMRQAAAQRVLQVSGEGQYLDQLHALLEPPPQLRELQPGGPQAAGASSAPASPIATGAPHSATGQANGEQGGGGAGSSGSGSWAEWQQHHEHIIAMLGCQLAGADAELGSGSELVLGGLGGTSLAAQAYQPNGTSKWWQGGPKLHLEEPLKVTPAMCIYARAVDSLLHHALINPLRSQARRIEASLMDCLLQQWGLRQQLARLREVYLLGSPVMTPFLHSLFIKISSRHGLSSVSEVELNDVLQHEFLAQGREDMPTLTVEILPHHAPTLAAIAEHGSGSPTASGSPSGTTPASPSAGAAGAAGAAGQLHSGVPTVHTLSRLRLRMERVWPLCLVASDEMLQQYNSALVLLMQVRWVKQSMDTIQRTAWVKWKAAAVAKARHTAAPEPDEDAPDATGPAAAAAGGAAAGVAVGTAGASEEGAAGAAATRAEGAAGAGNGSGSGGGAARRGAAAARLGPSPDGVQWQMAHLADAVLQYTWQRLLAAWHWLQQSLSRCQSLDEVQRCHAKYLTAVQRFCLLGSDTLSRLVHDALLRLLDCALRYCWLSAQIARGAAAAEEAAAARRGLAAATGTVVPPGAADAARQREAALRAQLEGVRREFCSRQRLLVRVLASRAGEAGVQAGEMRHLLSALDFNMFFEQK